MVDTAHKVIYLKIKEKNKCLTKKKKKEDAEQVAKNAGIDKSQVTKSEAGYFVAPPGIKSKAAKETYAKLRAEGKSAEAAARIAWSVEKKVEGKN